MTAMDQPSLEALGTKVEALTSAVVDLAERVLADKTNLEKQRIRDNQFLAHQRRRDRIMGVGFLVLFVVVLGGHSYTLGQTKTVCRATNETNRTLQDVFNLARVATPVPSPSPGLSEVALAAHLKREKERISREEDFFEEFNRRTAPRTC